jgi:Fe2+ transport system protein FeoA
MMKHCTFHPHSSIETAQACYIENLSKRADRRLQRMGVVGQKNVRMVKHSPPRRVIRNGVEYLVWEEDSNMAY